MRFPVYPSQVKRNTGYCNRGRKWFYREVYLKSEHWKELRQRKLAKVHRCEICGTKYCLDIHHLQYKGLYDVTEKDLQVLCRGCHENEHEKHRSTKTSFGKNPTTRHKFIPSKSPQIRMIMLFWICSEVNNLVQRFQRIPRTGKRRLNNFIEKDSSAFARSKIYNEQFKILRH